MATRTAAPADAEDLAGKDEEVLEEESGRGLTRGVKLAGLTAAAALVTYIYADGIAPRIPGIPEILGLMAGFAAVMIMITAAATAVSWLLRWHHRDIAAWSWKHGKRAASWGYGHGHHHGSRLLAWLTEWAAARWSARQGGAPDDDPDDEEPGPGGAAPGGERGDPPARPGPGPEPPAGEPATPRPVPGPPEGAPAPAAPPPPDGGEMPPTTTDRPVSATARTSGRKVPPVMRAVIAWIDDFEPENDADLHDFLQALAAGLHDVGASLNDLYELCTSPTVRIGKGGMTATHAAADSIAEAAGGVSGASKALASYYEGVSEEVAEGVELPKDGDFITGEGAGS